MYPFIAMLWHPGDVESCAKVLQISKRLGGSEQAWTHSYSADGISVYSIRPGDRTLDALTLRNNTGAILGTVFRRKDSTLVRADEGFTEPEERFLFETGGRDFMELYWGSYIAFFRDQNSGRTCVMRDPSGRLPCYRVKKERIDILFADISDVAVLGLSNCSINWKYVSAFLRSTELQIRDSGLEGVFELLAGECYEISTKGDRQFSMWDPARICRQETFDNYDEALTSVRETAAACVGAWSNIYRKIVLRLSGGLDSAIVLGAAKHENPDIEIVCINGFGSSPGEDERRYARAAALKADVRLIESDRDLRVQRTTFDSKVMRLPRGPKPTNFQLFFPYDLDGIFELARSERARAIWTGQGGDHIFLADPNAQFASDYLRKFGPNKALFEVIVDSSSLSGQSLWHALKTAWENSRPSATWVPNAVSYPAFSYPEPGDISDYISTPWMEDAVGLPMGKQIQLSTLAEVLNRHRPVPNADGIYEHHPLLSQPLVELCLRIPTYLLVRGGRMRAMAREAFQNWVPREILLREDKGIVTFTISDFIRRSENFIREFLAEGVLAKQGLIKPKAFDPYLKFGASMRPDDLGAILACMTAEAWARSWTSVSVRVAA